MIPLTPAKEIVRNAVMPENSHRLLSRAELEGALAAKNAELDAHKEDAKVRKMLREEMIGSIKKATQVTHKGATKAFKEVVGGIMRG